MTGLAVRWPALRPGQAAGLPLGRPATIAATLPRPGVAVRPVVAPCSVTLGIRGPCLAVPRGQVAIPGSAAGPGFGCVRRRCRGLSFRVAVLRFPVTAVGRCLPAAVLRR